MKARILLDCLHRGIFLSVGDVVEADDELLAANSSPVFPGPVCELLPETSPGNVEEAAEQPKRRK